MAAHFITPLLPQRLLARLALAAPRRPHRGASVARQPVVVPEDALLLLMLPRCRCSRRRGRGHGRDVLRGAVEGAPTCMTEHGH